MAWSVILWTSEWANEYSSYKTHHTEKIIYFDSCTRNWPNNIKIEMKVGVMKNWHQMVSIYFHIWNSTLSVPQIFNIVVDNVIKVNNVIVPPNDDPLYHIPRYTILLDFNSLFNCRENPFCKKKINKQLAKLAILANVHINITCYSICKNNCAWAMQMDAHLNCSNYINFQHAC